MFRGFIFAAAIAAIPGAALAQYGGYTPYQPYKAPAPYGSQPGQTTTTYDYKSGNTYRATPNYDGSTTVRGENYGTASSWRSTVKPNGDQSGVDSNGNTWSYDQSSGAYRNSNGTTCSGQGAYRTCY